MWLVNSSQILCNGYKTLKVKTTFKVIKNYNLYYYIAMI